MSVQRGIAPGLPAHQDLEAAVGALADTVADLRRLAHGVRPSRLEDGLAAALRALAADGPVPVAVTVPEVDPVSWCSDARPACGSPCPTTVSAAPVPASG
ncbi:hypothetical protein GCM10020358_57350 [Amorphoplanes nipponensis]|uniref:Uncharacterized protein n=1 Tax=Actinoplanes nipponensis TaxID=135950 RepID=A0A919JE95_9ACTN|nr:hypothetical protein [Actinoplanes nipponensis]GIE47770.1 hypothetical protein Ani05nite_13040 [Actinoplanes nipponensis]